MSVLLIINEQYTLFQRDRLEVIMVLLDTLRRLTDRCFNFDNDEEGLLEGFRRIDPKPEDFLPPHDPVVAACLGKLDNVCLIIWGKIKLDAVTIIILY